MGPAEGSDAVAGRVAHPGAGGVVSRTGLFERLGASARVTVVSAPPGSGKSVLLRSWIGEAGLMDSTGWVSVGRDDRDPQRLWLVVDDAHELGSAEARSSSSIPPPGSCSIALPRIAMTGPPWWPRSVASSPQNQS